MRERILAWMAALAMLTAPLAATAQDQKAPDKKTDDGRSAPSNVNNAAYPRIHPDLKVTFQLKAPEAKKVQVVGNFGLPTNTHDRRELSHDRQ